MKLSEGDDEMRKTVIVHRTGVTESTDTMDKLMNYCSSWHHLKGAVAWLLRLREGLLELEAATRHHDAGSSD